MSEVSEVYEAGTKTEQVVIPEATEADILDAYEQEEGEFEYIVGEGDKARKYVGKRLTSLSERIALGEKGKEFHALCEKLRKQRAEDVAAMYRNWKEFLDKPVSLKSAILIVYASTLLVRPKLSQLFLLRLHRRGADGLMEIAGPLMTQAEVDATEGTFEEIIDAKND